MPELDQSIKEAMKSVEDLNYYVDGAFKDGIVTETEAVAIGEIPEYGQCFQGRGRGHL